MIIITGCKDGARTMRERYPDAVVFSAARSRHEIAKRLRGYVYADNRETWGM